MTVQQLIEHLNVIEDKNIQVTLNSPAKDLLTFRVKECNVNHVKSTKVILYSDLDYF